MGGEPTFRRIVARFYAQVASDECCGSSIPSRISVPPRSGWRCFSCSTGAARVAVDEADLAEPYREQLWSYLESTANHMMNRPE